MKSADTENGTTRTRGRKVEIRVGKQSQVEIGRLVRGRGVGTDTMLEQRDSHGVVVHDRCGMPCEHQGRRHGPRMNRSWRDSSWNNSEVHEGSSRATLHSPPPPVVRSSYDENLRYSSWRERGGQTEWAGGNARRKIPDPIQKIVKHAA